VQLLLKSDNREGNVEHYTPANFSPNHSIGFALTKARNLIASEMDAALKDLDISSQQMGIMLSLQRELASTPFELSKLLSIDTGLMTRMLDKLETKGLLARSRSVEDRRVVNLKPTRKGESIAAEIPECALPVLNARLRKFSRTEFEELRRLLNKFIGE
jgi:DNA-binding MarR family transcriptional regulator